MSIQGKMSYLSQVFFLSSYWLTNFVESSQVHELLGFDTDKVNENEIL